jgi:putative heme-binding domain-containing protein
LLNTNASVAARAAAANALAVISPAAHEQELAAILRDPEQPQALREACARALADTGLPEAGKTLADSLASVPQALQTQIALAMASRAESANALLDAVEQGKASRRLLQDKTIKERLTAAKPAKLSERLESLTSGLPAEDVERAKLTVKRVAAFEPVQSSTSLGAQVFKQNCAICHSLDGEGATIGPQLDGVGGRGLERLVEDILDPSRNVDPAFRVTLLTLKNGDVESGLIRREEGETVVVADSSGKEHSLPKNEVTERRPSQLSLMPDNFSQVITTNDFNHLLAFLLSKNAKAASARTAAVPAAAAPNAPSGTDQQ